MSNRKTYDLDKLYKLSYVDLTKTVGKFQMPQLPHEGCIPVGLINFRDAMRKNQFDKFVHFYLNDGEIECIWRNPERYAARLKLFSGILSPDFSLYTDMPLSVQIWNIYRSRMIGCIFHEAKCKVIPTVSWSDSRSFSFAFDGIPVNSTVSVSSVGIWKDKKFYELFIAGLSAMIAHITPACIIFYGKLPEYDFGSIEVKQYLPDTFFWKKNNRNVYYKE